MHAAISGMDEHHARGRTWPVLPLLSGLWMCLGLVCIWLMWHTYSTYHSAIRSDVLGTLNSQGSRSTHTVSSQLVWALVGTTTTLVAWLGLGYGCLRRFPQKGRVLPGLRRQEAVVESGPDYTAHYWELFENASDFIYTIDMQGHLTSFNKAGEQILGYTREEICGTSLLALLTPESVMRSRQMRVHKEHGTEWTKYEVEAIAKDQRHVSFEVSTRLIMRAGTAVGIQGIARDVSERKQAEAALLHAYDVLETRVAQRTAELQESNAQLHREIAERTQIAADLRRAKEAAEVANRVKGEFLMTISHELRTPMNGICGMTGLLLETALDEEQREYAELVRTSSDHLLALINDILDFATISAGTCALTIVDFAPRIVLDDVLAAHAEAVRTKGLLLEMTIHEAVPPCVASDPGRLRQVLMILVGNAVKFTVQGTIGVAVTRVATEAPEAVLHFAITDTGIGIPPEAYGKLFQVFSQVDGSTTRQYGGTGLGLAIAKRLVNVMQGEIGVESTLGHGSTFWFTIPCAVRTTVCDADLVRARYGRPRRWARERRRDNTGPQVAEPLRPGGECHANTLAQPPGD